MNNQEDSNSLPIEENNENQDEGEYEEVDVFDFNDEEIPMQIQTEQDDTEEEQENSGDEEVLCLPNPGGVGPMYPRRRGPPRNLVPPLPWFGYQLPNRQSTYPRICKKPRVF